MHGNEPADPWLFTVIHGCNWEEDEEKTFLKTRKQGVRVEVEVKTYFLILSFALSSSHVRTVKAMEHYAQVSPQYLIV